ncbi:MAG: hypothetical protein ACYCST_21160 [Acidimicrobiales bacterium]
MNQEQYKLDKIVKLLKDHLPGVKISSARFDKKVLRIDYRFDLPHILIDGLKTKSSLANGASFSVEKINGEYFNLHETIIPDIAGKEGKPSLVNIAKTIIENLGLSVNCISTKFRGASMFPGLDNGMCSIKHRGYKMKPRHFILKTIAALILISLVIKKKILDNLNPLEDIIVKYLELLADGPAAATAYANDPATAAKIQSIASQPAPTKPVATAPLPGPRPVGGRPVTGPRPIAGRPTGASRGLAIAAAHIPAFVNAPPFAGALPPVLASTTSGAALNMLVAAQPVAAQPTASSQLTAAAPTATATATQPATTTTTTAAAA